MILHNDIWGDTSVTLIEEIDNQFLIVSELNMLAMYSRLNKEQSHALQEALATFYEILFSSRFLWYPVFDCYQPSNAKACRVEKQLASQYRLQFSRHL